MRCPAAASLFKVAMLRCRAPSSVFSSARTNFSSRSAASPSPSAPLSDASAAAVLSPLPSALVSLLSRVSRFAKGSLSLPPPCREPMKMPTPTPSPASNKKSGMRSKPFFDFPPSGFFSSDGIFAAGSGCSALGAAAFAASAFTAAVAPAATPVCSVFGCSAFASSAFPKGCIFMPQLVQNFASGFNSAPQYLQYIFFPPFFFRAH